MADALKTFREGEDILASETNENNQFLLSKLSDNAAQVQQYVEGEVATIKSNVASVQATLQNNIDELGKAIKQSIFLAIAPDYEKGEKVVSGTTLERSGWINWDGSDISDGAHIWLKVNGIEVCRHSKYKYGSRYKTMIYVGAGDTVTLSAV
jgi:hypothetical protein